MASSLVALAALHVTVCPFAAFLGLPCPGCGLTRATLSLASGHLALAVRYHPLSPLFVPAFVASVIWALGGDEWIQSRGFDAQRVQRVFYAMLLALATLLLVVWVSRFAGAFGGPVHVDPPIWKRL